MAMTNQSYMNVSGTTGAEFIKTKELFKNYINYKRPLSYDEWMQVHPDHKAAFLYVQFFREIHLAWTKARKLYGDECEGVSVALQYLIKNVPIIEEDPKRYSAKYIYRVAYNCLYCICHDRKCDKDRYEYEVSNIIVVGDVEGSAGDMLDLFDTVPDKEDPVDTIMYRQLASIVNRLPENYKVVVDILIGNPPEVIPQEVIDHQDEMVSKLREVLKEFACLIQD